MKLIKKAFLRELNKDPEWEYATAVPYVRHAARAKAKIFNDSRNERG